MNKPYSEMSEAERRADRIAKNRQREARALSSSGGLTLEGIVEQLNARKQRASYRAVAALVGVLPRGLMTGRPKSRRYSWVVAATTGGGSKRGWPTGYTKNQIHPECYAQICEERADIIEEPERLRAWLNPGPAS